MKPVLAVPAIAALVYRAYSKKSLTPAGIAAATLTAVAHAYHPWNLPFVLLVVFFLAGTRVTAIKKDVKARLTIGSKGTSGGEGPRTHLQVLANSLTASVITLLHAWQLRRREALLDQSVSSSIVASVLHKTRTPAAAGSLCFAWGGDLLVVGLIAHYAAVAADTFSSELGILATSTPRLITSPTFRKVPPGTNGGVTLLGLGAGLLGSAIVVASALPFLPLCGLAATSDNNAAAWGVRELGLFAVGLTVWGALGSVLDSVLGAVLQRTVRDVRSGKIVEGEGGVRVLVGTDGLVTPGGKTLKRTAAKAAVLKGEGADAVPIMNKEAFDSHSADPSQKQRKPSFGDERPTRVVESGLNLLDNNQVNFVMALTMAVGGMAAAAVLWGMPLQSIVAA